MRNKLFIAVSVLLFLGNLSSFAYAVPNRGDDVDIYVWPRFSQGESPWGDDRYAGKANKTMALSGCLVTSLTMLFRYHGMTYIPNADYEPMYDERCSDPNFLPYCKIFGLFLRIDPGTLNQWFTVNRVYNQNDDLIPMDAVKKIYLRYPGGYTVSVLPNDNCRPLKNEDTCAQVNWSTTADQFLVKDLKERRPDIMKISWTTEKGVDRPSHFVLIGGYDWEPGKESYRAYDPAQFYYKEKPYPPGLATLYSTGRERYNPLRVDRYIQYSLIYPYRPDLSTFGAYVFSPVEIQIIGPDKRVTGYNPLTGERITDIPRAYYTEESTSSVDPSEQEHEPTKVLFINKPVAGNYIFKVFGTGDGPYTVRLQGQKYDGTENLNTEITGTASPSLRETYRIVYSPTGDASLSQTNHAPVANAVPAQTGEVSYEITLDGSGSSDPDGDPMQYTWSLVSKPEGSTALLSDARAVKPAFIPDLPGTYTFQLTVNDYFTDSASSTVTITATPLKSRLAVTPNFSSGLSAGAGSISFDVNNIGRIGVSSGVIEIRLTDPDGAVVATGNQTFSIGIGQSTTVSVPVTIPALKFGNYTLTYTQSDETRTGSPTTAMFSNAITVAFSFDKVAYRVRETAGVTLNLTNTGRFNLEGLSLTVSSPDAGYTNTKTISLGTNPSTAALHFAVPLPASLTAGPHRVNVNLPLSSGSSFDRDATFIVPPSTLMVGYEGSPELGAGDRVPLTIENAGGVDTTYSSEKVSISDVNGVEIYQGSISGTVSAGERKALSTVLIPNQSASGAALVSVDIVDDATKKHVSLSKIIRITGLSATLAARTDKDIYLETETITGISTIDNGPFDIANGRLRVAIKKRQPAGSGKFSVLLPERWWSFERPQSVAVGSDGSVYVADIGKRNIQKFDADGNFVLEWGGAGSGDGQFSNLFSISAAPDGSVYVADSGNNRIQKFDSRGVFIAKWGGYGSAGGQFSSPFGVAVGTAGAIYVTDRGNNRIQKFTADGVFLSAWGRYGTGEGEFNSPAGIAVSSGGILYVADTANSRIQRFDENGNYTGKWGGYCSTDTNGDQIPDQPCEGQFSYPQGVAVGLNGDVFVADTNNRRVQKFDSSGGFIGQWRAWDNGAGQFISPRGLTVNSNGEVYVADPSNCHVEKFTGEGDLITQWGSCGAGVGQFSWPAGMGMSANGDLYIADVGNHRIQKVSGSERSITTWGRYGTDAGRFSSPWDVVSGPDGSVYVADSNNHRIQKFDSEGNFIAKWGGQGSGNGQFYYPYGIAAGPDGSVYVADTFNCRIQKFNRDGLFVAKWGSCCWTDPDSDGVPDQPCEGQFSSPSGVAVGPDGSVYVSDSGNYRIQKFDGDGRFIKKWGSYCATDTDWDGIPDHECDGGTFNYPDIGIAVTPDSSLFVVDVFNNRVQQFDVEGNFVAMWGSRGTAAGEFYYPEGVAVGSDGALYVADTENDRIQKMIASSDAEQTLFETTLSVDQAGAVVQEYVTAAGTVNSLGKLYFEAELSNSLDQVLARAEYPFYVVKGDTALLFKSDKDVYRPGETVTITGEVRNLAVVDAAGLTLAIKGQETGGQEQSIYTETLNVPAGGSHAFTAMTIADAEGVATLTGTVSQNSSALTKIVDRYEVAVPLVSATVSAPDMVGNELFSMNVALKNEGKVDASVSIQYAVGGSQGNTIDNQAVTIPAGETRLLQYAGQITQTTTYAFTFTGDLSHTITKTVVYGLGAKIEFGMQSAESMVSPEGKVSVPVTITNTGQLDETVTVAYDLSPGSGSRDQEARSYFLPKGGSITDTLSYDLTAGNYQVSAVSSQPNATAQTSFSVLKENVVTMTTVPGNQGQDGLIPVTMAIANSGYNEINGSAQLEVISNEGKVLWREQAQVSGLKSQSSSSVVINVDSSGLIPGAYPVSVALFDTAGRQLAENQARIRTEGPIFEITSLPNNPTFTAGRDASLAFAIKNTGTAAGAMRFGAKAMDVLNSGVEDVLQPGQEKSVAFSFAVPEDAEEKDYPAEYVLSSSYSQGIKGAAAFHVAQVKVGVTAVMDKDGYTNGETAALTMTVTKQSSTEDGVYVVIIRYGAYHDMQSFTLSSQPATVTFNVPLTEITGERLFYGVHFKSGRSVYQGALAINEAKPDLTSTFSGQTQDADAFVPEVKRDNTVEIMTVSSNYGKTASGATTIALYDGDSLIGTKPVPGIDPGTKENVSFIWNALGKGGDRILKTLIDPQDAVLEYSEANNTGVVKVRVPDITIFTDTDKNSYKIRQKAYITSTLTNLTADKTYSNLLLLTSAKDSSGKEVYAKSIAIGSLQPTASTTSTEAWSTSGLAADGNYIITQRVFAGSDLMAQSSKQVVLEKAPDFTLATDVSSRKIKQGEQARYIASVEPFSGWSHDVAFSMDGMPSGAAVTLSPETLVPPAQTVATVLTTDATPAGTYTLYLTAQGTDEGEIVSHTVPLTLDVSAFGLETALPSMTVKQLERAVFPITVMSQNGYEGSIGLSVTGLPYGVRESFDTATTQAPGTATLSIITSKYARPGTYTLTVTGNDGLVKHALSVSLVVQLNPAIAPAIITAPGPGPQNPAWVRLFDGAAQLTKEFTAFTTLYGARAVSADLDGDGYDEIVVAQGADPKNTGTLRAFRRDGSLLAEYKAFSDRYGLVLAAADMDGDWADEIIIGTGPDPQSPGVVKILKYTGTVFTEVMTRSVHPPTAYGLNVAAGDVDGDNVPEIITTPGPGPNSLASVTIWKYTGTTLSEMATFTTFEGSYGVNIAAGDIDGDGKDEIIAGTGPDPKNRALIRVYGPTGALIKELLPYDAEYTYGVTVAAADMDGDGRSEIIGGLGRGPQNDALVTILDANGNTLRNFLAYPASQDYGVHVSAGRAGQ